eukprot:m51a1_g14446 hypothetical protein (264) ;mRNA; r:588668-592817
MMGDLKCLEVHGNQLRALPPEIGTLTNLTQLSAYGNQLRALPPEIGTLTNLTALCVNGNQLRVLPPEIGTLTNLTQLSVYGNQLRALPPEIGTLTNLTVLCASGNPITDVQQQQLLGAVLALMQWWHRRGHPRTQLMHLSDEDLEELGVNAMGPRDELVELAEKLRDGHFVALGKYFGDPVAGEAGEAVPASFQCPITLELMEDPVVAPDGYVYEAAAIRRWLEGHDTSPMTGAAMAREPLVQCRTLRSDIQAYRQRSGSSHS